MREVNAGFIAILSLIFATTSSTVLRENYNHFEQAFSELGELNSPYYLFFNLFAFIIPGLLIYFSLSSIESQFEIEKHHVRSLKIGSSGWIITGLFPLSYSITWLYWIHIFGAFISFIFGPLGIIILSLQLSNKVKWSYFSLFSTILAFTAWSSLLIFDVFLDKAVTQLITIMILFTWYFLFLIKMKNVISNELKTSVIQV